MIPYSSAYPLVSRINIKDGSGLIMPQGVTLFCAMGPASEAVIREEIIFRRYLDTLQKDTPTTIGGTFKINGWKDEKRWVEIL